MDVLASPSPSGGGDLKSEICLVAYEAVSIFNFLFSIFNLQSLNPALVLLCLAVEADGDEEDVIEFTIY